MFLTFDIWHLTLYVRINLKCDFRRQAWRTYVVAFGADHAWLNEQRPQLSATKISPMNFSFWAYEVSSLYEFTRGLLHSRRRTGVQPLKLVMFRNFPLYKAHIIIQLYAVSRRLFSDPKMRALEWPLNVIQDVLCWLWRQTASRGSPCDSTAFLFSHNKLEHLAQKLLQTIVHS